MNLPLEKQTVLVTGAGRGLGSEIARSFHREGAKVIINYRNSYESAKNLSDSLGENAILVKGDIRDKDQVSKMHEELAYYNKIKKEMDDMKKEPVKKGIPLNWDTPEVIDR